MACSRVKLTNYDFMTSFRIKGYDNYAYIFILGLLCICLNILIVFLFLLSLLFHIVVLVVIHILFIQAIYQRGIVPVLKNK